MQDDDVAEVTTPQQFKALGHPMRHRLLFALAQGEATISQLAATLRDLATRADDGDGQPRYGLLLSLYQPAQGTPS